MKRALRVWLIVLLGAVLGAALPAHALTPYTTWTMGPGGRLFLTQDAYIPVAEVDLPVSAPEDMFLAPDGALYLADTGNGRILKLRDLEVIGALGKGTLKSPTGVTVDEDGVVYVTDAGNETVAIFEPDGRLRRAFGRPSEPLFGKRRQFLPRKLAVDARRNLYVVSEGSVDGLALMNTEGNFIGYFAANSAEMSLKMILQRLFLTREQLEQFVKTEAASPSNVAIDRRGLVYTVTAGMARDRSLRKFTINGRNLFHNVYGSTTFRDVQVSDAGLLLAVDANGQIYEYDLNGTLLFKFGASDRGEQRLGTLSNPTAIERAGDKLYVLDKDKNAIVVYQVTDFARRVHDGVRLYMEGLYTEAQPYFEDVLRYNGLFIMAYQAIADAHYKRGDYAQALATYRYAEDRNGYSQAFWELRNAALQRHLANAVIGVFGLWVAASAFNRLQRRHRWFDPLLQRIGAFRRIRLVDDFVFLFRFIKQPADSFYYIKANLRGSLAFAFILYAWVVVVRIASLYLTSFIFSPYANPTEIRVEVEAAYVIVALMLWNAANYLVSTISDGEGRLRDVIIGTAYSLFPYALFTLPIALVSNVLTLNEVFLHEAATSLAWFWVGLMLFLMVKEIHNYTLSETARNILITLFTMAMFLLTGYILYVLFDQLLEFISTIAQEVGLRG